MKKDDQSKSVDYPLMISIMVIGGLVSLASLIGSHAFGMGPLGHILASASLVATAVILGIFLYRGRNICHEGAMSISIIKSEKPYVITSLKGDMVYCNAPYRLFLKEDLKRDIIPPLQLMTDSQVTALQEALLHLDIGTTQSQSIQFLTGDNEKKYTEVAISRKIGWEGYVGWLFSGTTSSVPLENSRPADYGFSVTQLGGLLDNSNCGLLAVSGDGNIVYVNDILRHWMIGDSPEELQLPLPLSDFCLFDVERGPKLLNEQIQIRTLSGEDYLLTFLPLDQLHNDQIDQENPQYVYENEGVNLYQVFSSQTEVIPNDADSENINIDRFFRESPIGIAIVTEQGNVLERNNIFREYIRGLGIKNTRSLKHVIDPVEYEEFYNQINATLNTGQASSISDVGFKGRGEKHGHIYITPLHKFGENERVVILYLIDTTDQKNLELQFAQSQKMQAVGQLAGGVAHDFNNLLTAIIGFSDLLLVRHGPGDQSFSDIIQIKQNANRAANLVRQLLAFSRQQTLRPKVLILTDVLAELYNLLGRLIGDNIELEMTHGRDLGYVKVDQGQIEQVIINLCVNARDAMDNQGKITIRTRNISFNESKKLHERYQVMPYNEYVLLEVEDTGCGIAKEHFGKIFEPFFSTKEVGKGTGLGLSTVYGIVKQTDGFVFPESEVGKGTTFSIYLPVYKETQKDAAVNEAAIPEKPTRDLTGKGTILLVEDEDAVRMFASRALKNKGYNLYEANSGEGALELFQDIENELDLIISDVVMPIMDGPTLVRKIRETNTKLKVIFISGYAEDAFDKTPGDDDFHFLPKPFSLKQLAEKVKEVLEDD